jgi:hypothetical protein
MFSWELLYSLPPRGLIEVRNRRRMEHRMNQKMTCARSCGLGGSDSAQHRGTSIGKCGTELGL